MGATDELLVERREGVLTLTLNRPRTYNSLTAELFEALRQAFFAARFDREVRVVLLQGAGDAFCSGADMTLLQGLDILPPGARLFDYSELVTHLARMEKPVVAKVRGAAAGGGCSLALLTDFVVAAEDATFLMSFGPLGLVPELGAAHLLPRLVGLPRARAMALLGEPIRGRQAAEWGLIYQAVPATGLDAAVEGLIGRLLRLSPAAFGAGKRLLEWAPWSDIAPVLDQEMSIQSELIRSDYFRSAVDAFVRRRAKEG